MKLEIMQANISDPILKKMLRFNVLQGKYPKANFFLFKNMILSSAVSKTHHV